MGYILGQDRLPSLFHLAHIFIDSFNYHPIINAQGGGGYKTHLIASFQHFIIGFAGGSVTGFLFGIIITQSNKSLDILNTLVEFFRVIPPLLIIPFIFLVVGNSTLSIVLAPFVYSIYSVFVYTVNAVRNIERDYILLAEQFNSSNWQVLSKVVIPAITPSLVGGLKVTASISIGVVVVAEYLGGPAGIGRVINFASSYTNIDLIIVGVIWAVLFTIIIEVLFSLYLNSRLNWIDR
jgi:NitT/TauT family transport system permease protein